jgi:SAM-dependent methyltransferase
MAKEYEQEVNVCPQCGFIYTQNPFKEAVLAKRYGEMSKYEYDANNEIMVKTTESYKKQCIRQYNFIKSNINDFNSLFEIGCASGFNLTRYLKDGISVSGVEVSENNVKLCKKNYGIDLFAGTLKDYKMSALNHKKYDLVFLSHTLEHIINPYQAIADISEITGQYIFIEVPTFDYKFCDEPYGMFAEEHVNCFTFETLRELMSRLHFTAVDACINFCLDENIPAGWPSISTLWKRKTAGIKNMADMAAPVISSRESLASYLKKSEEKDRQIQSTINKIDKNAKLAVWGTGHHTSRLLGMTDLRNKNIVKFYDSDLRKNGAPYYGRTISPFEPSDLSNGTVETVLVSTYVAQRPIVDILEKNGLKGKYISLY